MTDTLSRRDALVASAALAAAGLAAATDEAAANQPNMKDAIHHLRQAIHSLEKASHNKGGHRVRAISLCEAAINEIEAGMRAAA